MKLEKLFVDSSNEDQIRNRIVQVLTGPDFYAPLKRRTETSCIPVEKVTFITWSVFFSEDTAKYVQKC
jgi:hypothetical protein